MLDGIGSAKVRAAQSRLDKEGKFLGALSVQCDEERSDEVYDNGGELLSIKALIEFIEKNPETTRFVLEGNVVSIEDVEKSLGVVGSCRETIKKFGGGPKPKGRGQRGRGR